VVSNNSSVGEIMINISTIGDIADIIYKLLIIFVGVALTIGYIYYLGEQTKRKFKLEKKSSFFAKIRIAMIGGFLSIISFILFSYLIITGPLKYSFTDFIESLVNSTDYKNLIILTSMIFTFPNSAIISYIILNFRCKEKNMVSKVLISHVIGASVTIIWAVVSSFFYGPVIVHILIFLIILFFFLVPFGIFLLGFSTNLPTKKVDVITKTGDDKYNLNLYQTTSTDYRLIDDDGNEYIIPISNVKMLVYKNPHLKVEEDSEK